MATTQDILRRAAFATGRLVHQATGEPVLGDVEITAAEGRVSSRVLPDGRFVVFGDLNALLPNIALAPADFHLTFRVRSPQFRGGDRSYSHPVPAHLFAGSDFDPELATVAPTALADLGLVRFPAEAVHVRGRVTEAGNPSVPIPTAVVEILHLGPVIPPRSPDAQGYYRFDSVTLTGPSRVRCSAAGFATQTLRLNLDLREAVNTQDFRLAP